jgi:hypothetical protein
VAEDDLVDMVAENAQDLVDGLDPGLDTADDRATRLETAEISLREPREPDSDDAAVDEDPGDLRRSALGLVAVGQDPTEDGDVPAVVLVRHVVHVADVHPR